MLIIGAALALRVLVYLANRSLWIDEAWLSLSIPTRGYRELLEPLDYGQSAPVVFLWLEKLSVQLFGVSERSLRLWPLIGGIAIVPLTYGVALRLLRPRIAALAAALVALAPMLVYYSAEVKPYSTDALVTLALIHSVLRWQRQPDDPGARRALGLAGAASVWMSAPAVFVLAGIGSAILADLPVWKNPARRAFAIRAGAFWVVSFAVAYLSVYRRAASSAYMQRFWGQSFLEPTDLKFFPRLWWALRELVWGGLFGHVQGWGSYSESALWASAATAPIICLVGVGAYSIYRKRGASSLLLVVGPISAAYGAALLGRYPVALRLMLFGVPLVAILVAAGVGAVFERLASRVWVVGGRTMVGCLLLIPFLNTIGDVTAPPPRPIRPLIGELERRMRPGEAVYLWAGAVPAWLFYTTDWSAPDTTRLAKHRVLGRPDGPVYLNAPSRGPRPPGEGRDLVMEYGGRKELLGTGSGMEYRAYVILTRHLPDSGWAENEAARIRAAARPGVWLLFSQLHPPAECALMWSLRQLGGRVTFRKVGHGVGLFRYEFGAPEHRAFGSIFDSTEWMAAPKERQDLWPEWVRSCPFIGS